MKNPNIPEHLLSPILLQRAHISSHGEYAWRKEDFESVLKHAKDVGLATIGGQAQFIFPDGIYEMYWNNFDSETQKPNESWNTYVARSADEVLTMFRRLCSQTNFQEQGNESVFFREQMTKHLDFNDFLWFVLYFSMEKSD